MFTILSWTRATRVPVALCLLFACGPSKPDDGADAGTATTVAAGSSGEIVTGSNSGTTVAPGSTGEVATDSETTTDTPIPTACDAMCQTYASCWPGFDTSNCQLDCAAWLAGLSDETCHTATIAARQCLATLECAQLLGDIYTSDCEDELSTEADLCDDGAILCMTGWQDSGECSTEGSCQGLPAEGLICTGDTCTCTLDGAKGPTCEVPGGACDLISPKVFFSDCCPPSP